MIPFRASGVYAVTFPHPSGQVRVVRFYVRCLLLPSLQPPSFLLSSSSCCQPSTASRHVQCSLPDLHCKDRDHLLSVFPAGPQRRPSELSVPCRTCTAKIATICSQRSLPERLSLRMSEEMSERMSQDMSDRLSDKILRNFEQALLNRPTPAYATIA